jgi:outer membrane biosynthesis protein TonB
MNQGPGFGPPAQSGRPGQMTAVMRAMQQATGPKVLRIGLVAAGRILEERIVKQRTSVTVGPSEKSMFVVQANVPAGFKLFELVGADYYLNFLDGMTGRVALATGITDLVALKGQAKRVGPAYQIRLTDEARGKVVIGETTFLFQFVAPPPVQPRPQLPLSVKGGVASQIDWNLTIIAAFSFLLHFGLIGAMYSDWMDPVVNDDLSTALVHVVQTPSEPPPIETAEPSASATTADTSAPAPTAKQQAPSKAPSNTPTAPAATVVAGLLNQAEQARIAILAALGGGPNITGAMKDDNGAPVDLNSLANREGGISNSTNGLNLPGGQNGPIKPGTGPGGLQNLHGDNNGPAVNSAATITKVVPVGDANFGGASASVPVANAESVIRSQLQPRARACYNAALAQDPTISGKLVLSIQIGADGGVTGVSASGMGGQIAGCISGAARRLQFASPGGGGSTISTSFNFVKQGGG